MDSYVAGFAFNEDKSHVLLIWKKRPEWQKGKINGVGGRIESGEEATKAMVREFKEEAGVRTDQKQWKPLILLSDPSKKPAWEVFFFHAQMDIMECRTSTDEPLVIIPTKGLDLFPLISNLPWLIPMAMDEDKKHTFFVDQGGQP